MILVQDMVAALRAKGWRLATAESCTGGMLGAAITDLAGASDVYDCGVITYSNASKSELLGVDPDTLREHGAVSEAVAREMALGVRTRSAAEIAISITGVAGPGVSNNKPEGRVCFGLSTPAVTLAQTVDFGALGRAEVRRAAVDYAIAMVLAEVKRAAASGF